MRYLLPILFLGLSACTSLNRSTDSGYANSQNEAYESVAERAQDLYRQKQSNIEFEAREELGLLNRPLTDPEKQSVETRIRLKRQEGKLATRREKAQYFKIRSALKSDRERLYFLSLPTFEARDRFAQTRGLGNQEETYSDEVAKTIESNDIALGMSQKAVLESWGDPDAIEGAGNQIYGYERWRYNRYISGNEGYQKEMRIVYFEGGRVVGWERP